MKNTFITRMLFLVVSLVPFLLCSCKNKKKVTEIYLNNPDDISIKDADSEENMVLRALKEFNGEEGIKVFFEDSIYDYSKFSRNVGFAKEASMDIIRDSLAIKEYGLENCKVLLVVNK